MKFKKKKSDWLIYSSIGIEFSISVLSGFIIGSWIDGILETEPWFFIIFVLLGVTAGYRSLFKLFKKKNTDN